jgi:O-acetyl-ADP-ribose deacetylase (regulator of RNase III)
VLALSRRWSQPEEAYRHWAKNGRDFELGHLQLVAVEADLWVANLIAQSGYRSTANPVALRYDALSTTLGKLAARLDAGTTSIHTPRIGAGLAGGDWSRIEAILRTELCERGFSVTVYDLPG